MAIKDEKDDILIGLDIGNTRTNIGMFCGQRIVGHMKISSRESRTSDEYWVYLNEFLKTTGVKSVKDVVIASVVPALTQAYVKISQDRLKSEPILISGNMDLSVKLRVDRPEEVGADRIANSIAASSMYKGDVIVVDLGTAMTFDVVSKEKEYLGGVIAPGIETSATRLFEKTAKLQKIEFQETYQVIGKNTEDAVRSGVFFGAVSQIDGVVRRIIEEWKRSPRVVATGGMAGIVSPASETIEEIDPFLTLKGLQIIYSNLSGDSAK
jgi:type III pantothenate kinase